MLDDRKSAILRAVVQQYIETAQPVGSSSVSAREDVGVVPGPSFATDGAFEHFLRLPYTLPERDLDDAVRTLASLAVRLDAGAVEAPAGVV